jgi:hypothetical protein
MSMQHHHNSFRRNNKAVSTIFGMVFFLLIVVIVFASFAVVLNQNASLEATMMQSRQVDSDKARESLVLKQVPSNNSFIINNTGTIPAQVVRLWAEDSSGIPISLQIPSDKQVILPNQELPFGPLAGASGKFRCWFVTARGNQFTFLQQGGKGQDGTNGIDGKNGTDGDVTSAITAEVANGIGSIAMNFEKWAHYDFSNQPVSGTTTLTSGTFSNSYSFSNNKYVVFHTVLTNVNNKTSKISLSIDSNMWAIVTQAGTVKSAPSWALLNVDNNQKMVVPGSGFTFDLPYNQSKTVYFGWTRTGFPGGTSLPVVIPMNILLWGSMYYKNGTVTEYGQNLPFVALKVTS